MHTISGNEIGLRELSTRKSHMHSVTRLLYLFRGIVVGSFQAIMLSNSNISGHIPSGQGLGAYKFHEYQNICHMLNLLRA